MLSDDVHLHQNGEGINCYIPVTVVRDSRFRLTPGTAKVQLATSSSLLLVQDPSIEDYPIKVSAPESLQRHEELSEVADEVGITDGQHGGPEANGGRGHRR